MLKRSSSKSLLLLLSYCNFVVYIGVSKCKDKKPFFLTNLLNKYIKSMVIFEEIGDALTLMVKINSIILTQVR